MPDSFEILETAARKFPLKLKGYYIQLEKPEFNK